MRVLLATLEFPPFKGGVAEYYKNIEKFWPEPENFFVLHQGLINNKLPFFKWAPSIFKLYNSIKKNNIDYVMVGNILPLGLACLIVSKIKKIKYAVVLHGTDIAYTQKSRRKKKIAEKIIDSADKIICNSSNTLEIAASIKDLGIKSKATVVNPGINPDLQLNSEAVKNIRQKYDLEGKTVLFSISRLIKRKGQDVAIKAFQKALSQIPSLELFIAGAGPCQEYLFQLAAQSGLGKDKIHFLGKISDEEKKAWYSACDIFILPSREERGNMDGFGIVYLEANLAGKPVIAGDSGGIKDAVVDGFNGFLTDPEDINLIAGKITALSRDRDLAAKMGERGRKRALKDFNWKDKAKQVYNFLKK